MAQVQVRCPNSGLWAWTGIEVDDVGWQPAQVAGQEVPCGICGERHLCSTRGVRVPAWS